MPARSCTQGWSRVGERTGCPIYKGQERKECSKLKYVKRLQLVHHCAGNPTDLFTDLESLAFKFHNSFIWRVWLVISLHSGISADDILHQALKQTKKKIKKTFTPWNTTHKNVGNRQPVKRRSRSPQNCSNDVHLLVKQKCNTRHCSTFFQLRPRLDFYIFICAVITRNTS